MTSAYGTALRRLARRDHSEDEMRRALRERGHAQDEIDATVLRLRQERALDDVSFAARYARSRMAHAGLGRNRIRRDLRARGVERQVAENGLRAAADDVSEAEVLERVARRYWSAHRADEPPRRLQKLWAFLLRRGFPVTLVTERLRHLWPRLRDALDGLEPAAEPEESRRDA